MNKIIFFNNENQKVDHCIGDIYNNFLDYAFEKTDYFMLVYVNYYGKGYTKMMKYFRDKLRPYKVKSRNNPSWPGTLLTVCPNTTYKVVFYRNCLDAKKILKEVEKLSDWSCPSYPQDLAFFIGNRCWAYSVGHEMIAAIIHADEEDLDFVEKQGLATREDAFEHKNNYFDAYDEILIED